jgi:nickel transport protein
VQAEGSGDGGSGECGELVRLLEQQKTQLSRELGQIKREVALLREELGKPGLKEIFAGLGYILGLAGVGLYIHCRRSSTSR